jgi:hypothetical protein
MSLDDSAVSPDRPAAAVPRPDLSQFDQLLPHSPEGDDAHE